MTTAILTAPATTATKSMGEWFTDLDPSTQATITTMVNEEGYPLSDIEEFIADFGEDAFTKGFYTHWSELTEHGSDNDAIIAFVDYWGIEDIEQFEDKYIGQYDSEKSFAKEYFCEQYGLDDLSRAIESGVVVDWEATWQCNLRHDFLYLDGYIFNRN